MYLRRLSTTIILITMTAVAAMAYSIEEIPNVHLTDKTQYVSNPDGVLRQTTVDSLNRSIAHIWQSSSAEVVAVVVNSIDGNDIDDYATALFRHWGIGKKDNNNGVLVLVSTEERKAVIRNGYGAEGILPDIICGRIIRDNMVPHFREGDYDGGMLSAVARIDSLLTTPGAVAELKSKYENDEKQENYNAFYGYLALAGSAAAILLLYVLFLAFTPTIKSRFNRYNRLNKIKLLCICATFFTLGMALPALIVLLTAMHYCRNKRRICPNCHSKMHKLPEDEDNKYLTPAQDLEEQLESIDYDVWLCDTCGEVDVYPFPNKHTIYSECQQCHARTSYLESDRIFSQPSTSSCGYGMRTYICRNCGKKSEIYYEIPKTAAPVVILPMGGGSRGGGGFGGGSFGGGSTGGGGASGGW